MQVTLSDFIKTIKEIERDGTGAPAFWKARDSLGNYLSHPLDPTKIENAIKPFFGKWRSYRYAIDWIGLPKLWTPNLQQIAHSLSHIHLEDAKDNELEKASRLYEALLQVQGVKRTNASKMLGVSLTASCMMWEQDVIRKFKESHAPRPGNLVLTPRKVRLYLDFLKENRKIANSLIEQCMQVNGLDRSGAIGWLQELPLRVSVSAERRSKPLAHLLDQYWYQKTRRR